MSEHVDTANLNMLKDLLGDKFQELVETFIEDASERIEAMRSALAVYDLETVRREVHGLKGSCRNIGAYPLGDLCQTMETQALEGALENGQQQFAAIEQNLAAVKETLLAIR